jgi:hypothetical protein
MVAIIATCVGACILWFEFRKLIVGAVREALTAAPAPAKATDPPMACCEFCRNNMALRLEPPAGFRWVIVPISPEAPVHTH